MYTYFLYIKLIYFINKIINKIINKNIIIINNPIDKEIRKKDFFISYFLWV